MSLLRHRHKQLRLRRSCLCRCVFARLHWFVACYVLLLTEIVRGLWSVTLQWIEFGCVHKLHHGRIGLCTSRSVRTPKLVAETSGGSTLGPGSTGPQILPSPPKFLIASIVISLSRCCLPNDEGPGPPDIFFS